MFPINKLVIKKHNSYLIKVIVEGFSNTFISWSKTELRLRLIMRLCMKRSWDKEITV